MVYIDCLLPPCPAFRRRFTLLHTAEAILLKCGHWPTTAKDRACGVKFGGGKRLKGSDVLRSLALVGTFGMLKTTGLSGGGPKT